MKILMLLDNQFPPDIRVEKEAHSLLKEGHEVAILSYMHRRINKEEVIKGIKVFRFWIPNQWAKKILGFSLQLPFYRLTWQRAIVRTGKSFPFDVIHIHDLPLCTVIQFIKRKFGIPVVADMHENYPFLIAEQPYMNTLFARIFLSKGKWIKMEKEWLGKADAIVCVAEEMKKRVETLFKNTVRIAVVPNTPSISEFIDSKVNCLSLSDRFRDLFIILYVGGIDAVRGIDVLIKSAGSVARVIPELKIIIVGEGKILSHMRQLVSSLHLEKIVVFEGWKPQDEIGSYISLSDVCVIPHRKSPQTDNSSPNKLFQYLYFKKPVISSDCNSIEKIIRTEKCGMIYQDNSPEELADQISYLYEHPEARNEMGKNGYEAVINKYNWESTVSQLLSIYTDIHLLED
jgi:glycosyltransferase involved in cell wall biosynthesis